MKDRKGRQVAQTKAAKVLEVWQPDVQWYTKQQNGTEIKKNPGGGNPGLGMKRAQELGHKSANAKEESLHQSYHFYYMFCLQFFDAKFISRYSNTWREKNSHWKIINLLLALEDETNSEITSFHSSWYHQTREAHP